MPVVSFDIVRDEPNGLPLEVSIVLPIYDEEESLPVLFDSLIGVMHAGGYRYEILAVNDGSRDGSSAVLAAIAGRHGEVRVIEFARNYGQTAALMAGFDNARGEIVITLDADLQNDPEDIPRMIEKLREGYDVVSGWRVDRQDAAFSRKLPSRLANLLISKISGVSLNDYGCTLKAYRREIMRGVRLYGEMHRFIPIYASWMGARVVEMPVRHHARQFGRSNYGISRVYKVLLDLLVAKFFEDYFVKPIYVFGGFGFAAIGASIVVLTLAIGLRLFAHTSLIQTPLPLLAAMLFLIGCSSVLMGLLAEIMMRTYFESQDRKPYNLRLPNATRTVG